MALPAFHLREGKVYFRGGATLLKTNLDLNLHSILLVPPKFIIKAVIVAVISFTPSTLKYIIVRLFGCYEDIHISSSLISTVL